MTGFLSNEGTEESVEVKEYHRESSISYTGFSLTNH